MTRIDFGQLDLNRPADRRAVLKRIAPDRATVREFHGELLDIFRREMAFRQDEDSSDEEDFFENIYWCALLLYLVGDPADVPLMWKAKQLNMDTACGFDSQFLIGAGLDETITYVEDNADTEMVQYVRRLQSSSDFQDLQEWEQFRIRYFYGA